MAITCGAICRRARDRRHCRDRAMFALGVMLVSPLWFFGLAVGGRRLATLAGSRCALRAADLLTAMLMLGLGAALGLAELGRP
jgi:arginine exporter protein ArgO